MARKKQRVTQHTMEDESIQIIERILPKHWVSRRMNSPDYGIDLIIELFEKKDERISEVFCEYLYVQVKSVQKLEIKSEKVFSIDNISKVNWKENKSESRNIDVAKFVIDTNSLFSIESLGASISVLLFLVDLQTEKVYFICLNDYIDKILLPKNCNYADHGHITLNIPILNSLANRELSESALSFYGKRSKLLAAFSKFSYQKNELYILIKNYGLLAETAIYRQDQLINEVVTNIKRQTLFFIKQIEHLEIWQYEGWKILEIMKYKVIN